MLRKVARIFAVYKSWHMCTHNWYIYIYIYIYRCCCLQSYNKPATSAKNTRE